MKIKFESLFELDEKEMHKINLLQKEIEIVKHQKMIKAFEQACIDGDLESVQYLLNNKNLPFNIDLQESGAFGFSKACEHGQMHIVKYLLTSFELKEHINLRSKNGEMGLSFAAFSNQMDIVKYLLTSPDLKVKADIHFLGNDAILMACCNDNVEIVKYLLTSKDLEVKADAHAQHDSVFLKAFKSKSVNTLFYLINEYQLEKTPHIQKFMDAHSDICKQLNVDKMFKVQEMNKTIFKHEHDELKPKNKI